MRISFLILFFFLVSNSTFAQDKGKSYITIQGNITQRVDKLTKFNTLKKRYGTEQLSDVEISILVDNHELFKSITDKNGAFEIKFNLQKSHIYTLKFEKKGFYPKVIDFNTKEIEDGRELKIRNWSFYLYSKIKNVNDSIFQKPYKMDYDEEYKTIT